MLKRISLVFISLLIFIAGIAQQKPADNKTETKADTAAIAAIPLANLSDALNSAQKDLKFFNDQLLNLPAMENFDSVYTVGKFKIEKEKELLALNEKQFGQREISDALKEWQNYSDRINKWLNLTSSNLAEIDASLKETDTILQTWKLTFEQLKEEEINYTLRTTANEVVKEFKDIQKEIKQKQEDILIKQDKLNNLLYEVNDVIFSLQNEEKLIKTEYFKRASHAIWSIQEESKESLSISESLDNALKRHGRNFTIFYLAYQNKFALHIFLFILLLIGFYYLNKAFTIQSDESHILYFTSKEVVSKYILSATIVATLLSVWIYPARQNAINDLLQLILLLFSFSYLAKGKRNISFLLILTILLFILNQAQVFFNGDLLITRPAMLIESAFSGWILFMLVRPGSEFKKELLLRKWNFIVQTIPLLLLFSVVAFFANVLGYTNLAALLSGTSSNSLFNAIDIVLATLVIRSVIIGILHSSISQYSNLIKNKGIEIEKNLLKIIQFLAVLIWIKTILINLTIYEGIYNWIAGLFKISFTLGKTEIVLGNFFSFALLILITVYLTKFVKLILEDEVFPRITLPRGVPGAATMIIGYILAGLGGYFAISAAGVNLSEFGLIVGALSVGIGFGLQGVVLNFISGLILAFERPIQIGDTVEIGTLTGVVKSIGVRSSKIQTYDGMEVVVPNGNMISNNLINWTLSDRKRRYDINVGVAYGTDPHKVLALLKKVASENPDVMKYPEPWALFDGFGDSSLNFRVRIWTSIDTGLQTKSDITVGINDALNAAGIEIPFPQRDLHVRSIDDSVEKAINEKKVNKPKKTSSKQEDKAPE
jgi:potassium-dependent mechanosensitive channel